MTNNEAFLAFAHVAESNPRLLELIDKYDDKTATDEEINEMLELYDEIYFNPFVFKNFLAIDEEDDPEEDARIKAEVQSMIDRGVISAHHP